MAVPRQKHTKSRRNKRRMHIFLKEQTLTKCSQCGHPVLPHRVCSYCGHYKGKKVSEVLERLDKKERKEREKEIKKKGVKT